MKTTMPLTEVMAAFCGSSGNARSYSNPLAGATAIYSSAFKTGGAVNIFNISPNCAASSLGGSAGAIIQPPQKFTTNQLFFAETRQSISSSHLHKQSPTNMKLAKNLLLTVTMLVSCCAIGNAQTSYTNALSANGATIIYSNAFTGGAVDISGTAPTYINSSAPTYGGSLSAKFVVVTNSAANGYYGYQNGTLGAKLNSVILPFTPVSGYVYTLSATLTYLIAPPAGGYGGFGFAKLFPASNSGVADPRLGGTLGGNPWALLNLHANGGGTVFNANGAAQATVNNLMSTLNTPYPIVLILDTTTANWTAALYVNGTLVKVFPYGTNPTLASIGYTQTTTTAGAFSWGPLTLFANPLIITEQPFSATVAANSAFTNTFVVAATAPRYQWYTNGVALVNGGAISGANANSLIINPVTSVNAGADYYCIVTNSLGGSNTTAAVSLTVESAPVITAAWPVTYSNVLTASGMTLYGGTNIAGSSYSGSSPTFSVSAIGAVPIFYQWFTNGAAVGGATNLSFIFTNTSWNAPTNFTFVVTNAGGAATNTWLASYAPVPVAPFPDLVMSYNPVGFWRLNEGPDDGNGNMGVLALDYAGGNDGMYSNAVLAYAGYPTTPTDPTVASARFAYAGTPSAVYGIQGIDFSNNATATFSVQAWINGAASQPNGAGVIAKGYNGGEQFALDISGDKYRFTVRDAAGTASSVTAGTGPDGNWHFVTGVCDETNGAVSLYVDGLLVGSAPIASGSGVLACATPITIGARGSLPTVMDDLQFRGWLSDVAVYGTALSAGQVATLYTAAGYSVGFTFVPPLPPTNFVYQVNTTNSTVTLPATVFGIAPIGYYWTNVTAGGVLGSGSIASFGTYSYGNITASLTIPNAPASLSGDQLELVVTNAASITNVYVTLFNQPPPVTLDYTSPILYSNYFNGGLWSIAGKAATAANMLVGGTNAVWSTGLGTNDNGLLQSSGVDATTNGNSWLLPFTPHAGYVYTETVSLTLHGNPGNWVGAGYTVTPPTASLAAGQFGNVTAYDWIILTSATANVQYFVGPGGIPVGGLFSANGFYTVVGTHTVQVVLDTTGAQWVMSSYVDGNGTITNTYSSNPPIGGFGITQAAFGAVGTPADVQWDYVALTQVAPGGVPPYLLAPLPPTTSITLTNATVSLAATAFGSGPLGYSWVNNSTVIASGVTNTMAPLPASLSVPSSSLSGGSLALVVTNAYGTNTTLITLISGENPNPGPIQVSVSANQLTMGWPTNLGWTLQVQTNNLSTGLSNNWVNVPGSITVTNMVIPINPTNGPVFYRLQK